MPLSSNSLIHFTSDKDSLKGILEDNFKIYNYRESFILGGCANSWIIPMISFCDIPLSQIKMKTTQEGTFGDIYGEFNGKSRNRVLVKTTWE